MARGWGPGPSNRERITGQTSPQPVYQGFSSPQEMLSLPHGPALLIWRGTERAADRAGRGSPDAIRRADSRPEEAARPEPGAVRAGAARHAPGRLQLGEQQEPPRPGDPDRYVWHVRRLARRADPGRRHAHDEDKRPCCGRQQHHRTRGWRSDRTQRYGRRGRVPRHRRARHDRHRPQAHQRQQRDAPRARQQSDPP